MGAARHGYLATTDAGGAPHVVPVTFALVASGPDARAAAEIVTAVDHKPKTTADLRRLRNLAVNPRAAVLVDSYDDDWSLLWWVRADGVATVEASGRPREDALDALAVRYPQYRDKRPDGPVIRVRVARWSGWASSTRTA